ncbi:hypothetical protein CCUG62472_01086 [Mycobacteroides salmoniphilum]|nr:hypothetical protein CCUG62472_01086 [Mycobacteroides salmoniphilum]
MDFAYLRHPTEPSKAENAEAITQLISQKTNAGGHV